MTATEELPKGVPPDARKVPGLKLWADARGQLWGPMGSKIRIKRQRGRGGLVASPMTDGGRQTSVTVRRAVALAWLGPQPDGTVLRSLDGNLANSSPDNLAWRPKKPRDTTQHWAEWSAATAKAAIADPDHPAHGKRWLYGMGCRCRACTNAQRVYWHKIKLRKNIDETERRIGGDDREKGRDAS